MIDEEEVFDFLEHHGVKGQKWGVRKAEKAQAKADRLSKRADEHKSYYNRAVAKSAQGRAERLHRIAKGQGTAQDHKRTREEDALRHRRIIVGSIVAGLLVASFAPTIKVHDIAKVHPESAVDVLRRTKAEQMSSLTRTFKEGHMNEEQYKKFSAAMHARYERKIAEAMKGGK